MMLHASQKAENWKPSILDCRAENTMEFVLWYRHAPTSQDGEPYPPIDSALIHRVRRMGLTGSGPRLAPTPTTAELLGDMWEVCCRHEAGEYDDRVWVVRDAVNQLVSAVHAHLGNAYPRFAREMTQ